MDVDVVPDGHDELFEILENAAPDAVMRDVAEEAFHHVEPGCRGRRKAHVESFVFFQPALHSFMLVGRVVVADQIDFLVGRHGLIDQTQKLEPLLMPVFLLAQAEDLAVGNIQCCKSLLSKIA